MKALVHPSAVPDESVIKEHLFGAYFYDCHSDGPARVVLTLRLKTLQVPQFILFRSNWLRLNVSQIAHRAFLFELIQSKIGTKESSTKEGSGLAS